MILMDHIVLYGNEKRMKIDDHGELGDIFPDKRVECLYKLGSWRRAESIICLLEDPSGEYST